MFSCRCLSATVNDEERSLDELQNLRDGCPALCLMIPDWNQFAAANASLEAGSSGHRSVLLLAFERGHLGRITGGIHRYLLVGDEPHPKLTRQYLQDLRELWILRTDALDRHRKSRIYFGKLMELFVAEWSESQGWKLRGLEALGDANDVIAEEKDGVTRSI